MTVLERSPEFKDLHASVTTDELTILAHSSNLLTKKWTRSGEVTAYDDPKYFGYRKVSVAGIEALAALLTVQATRSRECLIRGRYLGDAAQLEHNGRDFKRGQVLRRKNCFADQALHTVLIDIDGYQPFEADPVTEPVESIEEYILCCLPGAFASASYYWQLSSSAGHTKNQGVLKAHVWFWLEDPVTSASLRAWANASRYTVDKALFDTIQVHYTADPIFEDGVADPVPVRHGFERKARDSVALDITDVPVIEKPSRLQMLSNAAASDPTAQALNNAGMLKSGSTGEGLHIICPFDDEHSGPSADSATVYYPAHTGGYHDGHFKCLHAHCADRTDAAFREKLGVSDDREADFDAQPETDTEGQRVNSFQLALKRAEEAIRSDLIKGVIPDAEFGIIYGSSGAGKSFAAIDLGYHLAQGRPWRGRKVKQRDVFYIAAEGAHGVRRRAKAYALHHGVDALTPFYTRERPINMHAKNGWVRAAEDINELAAGEPGVIFIDTLSRSIPGVEENSAKDMSQVIENCQMLGRATGCMVIVIAHAGKDKDQGVRGSSTLRAAADFELAVTRHLETQWRCLKLTKSKDDVDGVEFGFTLTSVEVGVDEDGDTVCSAVAVPSDDKPVVVNKPQSKDAARALDAVIELADFSPDGWVDVEQVIDRVLELYPNASKNARYHIRRWVSGDSKLEIFDVFDGKVRHQIPQPSPGDVWGNGE
ncbi:AAA domain-containing protein [Paraburkholderia sp. BL6665CI2N2]|uniref:AAA family ATPase n=1 Tax=Paraburkholderia sp. BL6665CI2N2 TaxID=1938806 RepID=UPI0010CE7C1F|nr:AAA family ATPase [Paraburkholderia sp. BL6665CI2N2]TDY25758.1 AAA domain-containing protein [Paraburkholderia sp. BL6665CI2N2]